MTFVEHVETEQALDLIVEKICGKFDANGVWNEVTIPAALHFYLANHVDNEERRSTVSPSGEVEDVKSFTEVMETGGNCVDKSVFLASLLVHVSDLEVRFLEFEKRFDESSFPDEELGHVLLQLRFPERNTDFVSHCLTLFYNRVAGWDDFTFLFQRDDAGEWWICDPALGKFIGDAQHLVSSGFVEVNTGEEGLLKFRDTETNTEYVR